jgi:hypothetical protein
LLDDNGGGGGGGGGLLLAPPQLARKEQTGETQKKDQVGRQVIKGATENS